MSKVEWSCVFFSGFGTKQNQSGPQFLGFIVHGGFGGAARVAVNGNEEVTASPPSRGLKHGGEGTIGGRSRIYLKRDCSTGLTLGRIGEGQQRSAPFFG